MNIQEELKLARHDLVDASSRIDTARQRLLAVGDETPMGVLAIIEELEQIHDRLAVLFAQLEEG